MADCIHTFSDKSILRKMTAKDLVKIPIWKGNRILNEEHKREIMNSLKGGVKALDLKPYHIITYPVEDDEDYGKVRYMSYVADGQHRLSIIQDAFLMNPHQENFELLVVEKECVSENDAIEYFKILNTTLAIKWQEDPAIVVNSYVRALEKEFNKGKIKCVRPCGAHRPYLATDKLREAFQKYDMKRVSVEEFIAYARKKNTELLSALHMKEPKEKLENKALSIQFALALDTKFKWLRDMSLYFMI
jgi:hypothetical protein